MLIDKKFNYIFDFDGTIVDLHIDWFELKKEVNNLCENFGICIDQKLNNKVDLLKEVNSDVLNILLKYEQVNNEVSYSVKPKTIELLGKLDEFYIVSNNLNFTIKKVLYELEIFDKCKKIIAIDDVKKSKPSTESFILLEEKLSKKYNMYIGDRNTDKEFAYNCNMFFTHIDTL